LISNFQTGTSQESKQSLFKFQDREEDFHLFAIDVGDDDGNESQIAWIKNQFKQLFVGKVLFAITGGGDIGSEYPLLAVV